MIRVIIERLRGVRHRSEDQQKLLDAYEFLGNIKEEHEEGCKVLVQARADVTGAMDAGVRSDVVVFKPKAPNIACTCRKGPKHRK